MKKFLFAFIIIMSSFFFCNFVNASTVEYTITEEEISYITSEHFEVVRQKAIEYATENNRYYRIEASSNTYYTIYFYEKNDFILKYPSSGAMYLYPKKTRIRISYNNGVFYDPTTVSSSTETFLAGSSVYYYSFLDTNFENFIFDYSDRDINFELIINYENTSYVFTHNSTFKSLYDMYIENQEDLTTKYSIVSSFYILVIEKINLFTSLILQNYIFLFIIAILILIFLIELIRRYLL